MELQSAVQSENWVAPSQNIRQLFELQEEPSHLPAAALQESEAHAAIAEEDLDRLPPMLGKLVRKMESIRADMDIQKKAMIATHNEMKHAQNMLTRFAKKCVKQSIETERIAAAPAAPGNPRGFARPTKVSDELCAFMGCPAGTPVSRTATIIFLNKYIKLHELQDPENLRYIRPDVKLQALFGEGSIVGGNLTFFKMQKYLSQHFPK